MTKTHNLDQILERLRDFVSKILKILQKVYLVKQISTSLDLNYEITGHFRGDCPALATTKKTYSMSYQMYAYINDEIYLFTEQL